MDFKRALVRPQKGISWKPIGRLFKAKRACVAFKVCEKSLHNLISKGTKSNKQRNKFVLEDTEHGYDEIWHYLLFSVQLAFC